MYLFLSLFYPPLSLSMSCSSNFTYISFDPLLISAYLSYIDIYLFLSLCQSKFRPISFNPVFFISAFSSYIHLYLSLCLVYPPLFLLYFFVNPDWCLTFSIPLSIQIDVYLFQSNFLYLCLIPIYPPVSIFISFLSTTISLYLLFIQLYIYLFRSPSPNLSISLVYWHITFSISLSIQIHACLFQSHFLYLCLLFVYPPIFFSMSCLSTSISFISLCQSRLMPISFYLLSIHIYFFISLFQSKFMFISFNPIFFISAESPYIHLYLCLSLFYPPLSLSISCLCKFTYISWNLEYWLCTM